MKNYKRKKKLTKTGKRIFIENKKNQREKDYTTACLCIYHWTERWMKKFSKQLKVFWKVKELTRSFLTDIKKCAADFVLK